MHQLRYQSVSQFERKEPKCDGGVCLALSANGVTVYYCIQGQILVLL